MKRHPRGEPRGPRPIAMTVRIDDLAPGGDGVAHATIGDERRAVFVPRVAIGDELEVDVDVSLRPARGTVVRLVTPGPGRVDAPCTYVDACGACDWMHLSRSAQRAAREDHLRRALPPSFHAAAVVVHDAPETTGPSLGYRTRARLHVRASGGRAILGPHAARTNAVVDVRTCVVLHPALDAALAPLASLLEGAHGEGEAQLALGADGKPVLELRFQGKLPATSYGRLEQGVHSGAWAGARVFAGDVTRPAVVGDPTPRATASDGAPLVLAPGGFAQASDTGNLLLGQRVLALAKASLAPASSEPASLVELYAGAGNFTVLLARAFARVTAVESNEAACEAARKNLAARDLHARVTCADADSFALPAKTDVVVLDPPRRGARAACAALASSSVKAIVYVSCDAPTLGRDLAVLAERFEPVAIESFAMFPGTSHAETVVALRRVRARGRP